MKRFKVSKVESILCYILIFVFCQVFFKQKAKATFCIIFLQWLLNRVGHFFPKTKTSSVCYITVNTEQ